MPRRSRISASMRTLLLGGLLASGAVAEARAADEPEASESEGTNWGPIVGGCLGVIFGGALALWQIRGMQRRD